MSVDVASPIDISYVREESGLKDTPFPTETCPFPHCGVTCGRTQDLERHVRQHLPHFIYCEQPDCKWTGNRLYALRIHHADKHSGVPVPELELFMIYDAKALVKRLLNKEINVEQAVGEARSLFQKKAVQLGKVGIWRWLRGQKATCIPTSLGI
jgi:hypothetical protein